jgi:hypothetical protein
MTLDGDDSNAGGEDAHCTILYVNKVRVATCCHVLLFMFYVRFDRRLYALLLAHCEHVHQLYVDGKLVLLRHVCIQSAPRPRQIAPDQKARRAEACVLVTLC